MKIINGILRERKLEGLTDKLMSVGVKKEERWKIYCESVIMENTKTSDQ